MQKIKTVDDYIEKHSDRKEEISLLRAVLIDLPYIECIKWGMPTYTVDGKNVVSIGSFNDWSCLWFHQGAFLKDEANVLNNAQDGKTKGMRQWRFSNVGEIDENLVKSYLAEAFENQKAGKEIKVSRPKKELQELPRRLQDALNDDSELKKLFTSYTISQRNDFSNYIKEAKREKTKEDRLQKVKDLIKKGKKLNSLWA